MGGQKEYLSPHCESGGASCGEGWGPGLGQRDKNGKVPSETPHGP